MTIIRKMSIRIIHITRAANFLGFVAAIGVMLPFLLGNELSIVLGFDNLTSLFMDSALTATSVGISARVLFDFGKAQY